MRTLLIALLAAFVITTPAMAATPVLDTDFPDPMVLPVDNGLVAYATNGKQGGKRLNVQVSRSSDGKIWSAPVDAMPKAPRWARSGAPDIWAPEVMKIGNQYVMYFSARHKVRMRPDGLTLCVGIAVADAAEGPFKPQPEPLTCGGELGVIDASPFRDGDTLWLYVKTDGNCCGVPIGIIAQRLSADGQHLEGRPALVEGVTNDVAWEGGVIEGQQMINHDGRYYMVYAANDYGSDKYATGYAVCAGPTGPCQDAAENPILKSAPDLVGPGHQSVFDFQGRTWIAYHAWRNNADARKRYRAMYISPLDWVNEKPVITP
jgi:beta-xylosidase